MRRYRLSSILDDTVSNTGVVHVSDVSRVIRRGYLSGISARLDVSCLRGVSAAGTYLPYTKSYPTRLYYPYYSTAYYPYHRPLLATTPTTPTYYLLALLPLLPLLTTPTYYPLLPTPLIPLVPGTAYYPYPRPHLLPPTTLMPLLPPTYSTPTTPAISCYSFATPTF